MSNTNAVQGGVGREVIARRYASTAARLLALPRGDAAFEALAEFCAVLGLTGIAVHELGPSGQVGRLLWSSFREDRQRRLAATLFLREGPVHRLAALSSGPSRWTLSRWSGALDPVDRAIVEELRALGLCGGIFLSVRGLTPVAHRFDGFGEAAAIERLDAIADHLLVAAFCQALLGASGVAASAPAESLTRRERQALELSAHGLSNRAIAERLGVGEATVKFHLSGARKKLRARNTVEAVARFSGRISGPPAPNGGGGPPIIQNERPPPS